MFTSFIVITPDAMNMLIKDGSYGLSVFINLFLIGIIQRLISKLFHLSEKTVRVLTAVELQQRTCTLNISDIVESIGTLDKNTEKSVGKIIGCVKDCLHILDPEK